MAIFAEVVVGHFPYGNPGSVGEPLGIWAGESNVTGDATGGAVDVDFEPQNPALTPTLADQRRQYVYFIDDAMIIVDSNPGQLSAQVSPHWARANSAIGARFRGVISRDALTTDGNLFAPIGLLVPDSSRTPIFWDTQELAGANNQIVRLTAENNVLAADYEFRAWGRYYDRQVLSNRAFGRLISPVAVSQFEG